MICFWLSCIITPLFGDGDAQATVVDNGDGSYALQFQLPLPGAWQLCVSVNGAPVPCPEAAAIPAAYGRLTAAECEIEGVEGAVACGTSDPIFIQVHSHVFGHTMRSLVSGFLHWAHALWVGHLVRADAPTVSSDAHLP